MFSDASYIGCEYGAIFGIIIGDFVGVGGVELSEVSTYGCDDFDGGSGVGDGGEYIWVISVETCEWLNIE